MLLFEFAPSAFLLKKFAELLDLPMLEFGLPPLSTLDFSMQVVFSPPGWIIEMLAVFPHLFIYTIFWLLELLWCFWKAPF